MNKSFDFSRFFLVLFALFVCSIIFDGVKQQHGHTDGKHKKEWIFIPYEWHYGRLVFDYNKKFNK
jgi:hypothetical protein